MRKKGQRVEAPPVAQSQPRLQSSVGVRQTQMPVCGTIPPGVRVVDARGGHAVGLAYRGFFIGIFLRR